ncbi:LysM peptidoglycan-binding domain-containing protein [Fundicoccus ignavus]|uniref:LysM peptidoglycan-binding domain-containing protein n=1 Tax=Fundicoccus ignavus TaxID=2664442 RepID=A0A844CBD2_9LACT|nr:LysM domain-containing protein [Fundicoccus ignavus]MRJ46791.1 LysM peptidoglycan-binding domain-containing protein [Fundicoccus ignavus]
MFKLGVEGLAWSNGRANVGLSEMKEEVRLMNFRKKLWLGCSVLALAGHALAVPAQVTAVTWQARDLNEVLSEVEVTEENALKYTVKYGDTLSVISEAMDIDLRYLAAINEIDNVDLIFPDTLLTAQFDDNHQVDGLSVNAPSGESVEVYIPVNLSPVEAVEEIEVVVVEATPAESEEVVEEEIAEEIIEEEVSEDIVEESIPELDETLPSTPEVGEGNLETDVPTEEPEAGAVTPEEEIETPEVTEPEEEVEVPEEEVETPEVTEPEEEVEVPEEEVETPEVTEPEKEVAVPEEEIETPEVTETEEEVAVSEEEIETPEVTEPEEEVEVPEEEVAAPEEEVETPEVTVPEEEVAIPEEEIETPEEPEYVEPEEPEYVEPEEPEYVEPEVIERDPAGLSANAAAFRDLVVSMYGVTAYGLRSGDSGDHGTGLAVDFMVPVGSELGDAIANFAIANMGSYGISYVIWEQQIYGDWSYSWVPMEDRGSITANHYDHVHVSFNY